MNLEKQFLGAAENLLPWMNDETVTDVLINGLDSIYVERSGELERVPWVFPDSTALSDFLERILVPLGKRLDAARPYLDGRLVDGTRFHVILPPLAARGPILSLRKSRTASEVPLSVFGRTETIRTVVDAFRGGTNVLVSGGTGSGKTTLLTRLLDCVDESERLVIVEETSEIRLEHPHAVFLEARPPTPDGAGEVTLRQLLRNALRMRPSRLVLGECRGEEAMDLIQAMNTGHRGSICTLHANSPMDALRRLETWVLMSGVQAPLPAVREWIAGAIGLVIHLERQGGARQIAQWLTLQGLEGERYRVFPHKETACEPEGFVRDYHAN